MALPDQNGCSCECEADSDGLEIFRFFSLFRFRVVRLWFHRQLVEAGAVGFFVERALFPQDLIHFLAKAERDLGFGLGFLQSVVDQPVQGFADVGGLRGSELLLNGGEEVGK